MCGPSGNGWKFSKDCNELRKLINSISLAVVLPHFLCYTFLYLIWNRWTKEAFYGQYFRSDCCADSFHRYTDVTFNSRKYTWTNNPGSQKFSSPNQSREWWFYHNCKATHGLSQHLRNAVTNSSSAKSVVVAPRHWSACLYYLSFRNFNLGNNLIILQDRDSIHGELKC